MNAELKRHNTVTDYHKEFGKTTSDINKQLHSNTTLDSLQLVECISAHTPIPPHCAALWVIASSTSLITTQTQWSKKIEWANKFKEKF